jgi:hypothetical protein
MRGHRFSSLEEVSAAVTRATRGMKKSGTLNGIANLPKRSDAVIEKQGSAQKDCKEILPKTKYTCN